jgi:hypothetical protein
MPLPKVGEGLIEIARRYTLFEPYGQKTETTRGQSKIDSRHEEQEVVETASVRDGIGEPEASPAE